MTIFASNKDEANVFKPAMVALIAAIAGAGLVACSATGDNSEPVSKLTQPSATASVAQSATPSQPDTASNPTDTVANPPDTAAKGSDLVKEATPEATAPEKTSTDARPANSSRLMAANDESTSMPMPGQANDHSVSATQPIPKN